VAKTPALPKHLQLHSRNWLGKASAGLVLGYALALALSGLFAWFGPGEIDPGKLQINMWMVSPIWCLVLSFCFFFRTGLRAWAFLGLATLLAFGLLFGGRMLFT
jgi:predicted alpha/beta hydrolase